MSDQTPLKLLVITMMYEPDCVGIAAIASDMCAGLAQRGHDVTVYTTYPYYPEWKLKTDAPWRIEEESIDQVQVRRHRIIVPSKPSRLLPRLMHELSFPVSLLRSFRHGRSYDLVMVYCPLIGGILFAAARKIWYRDPLWINIQDMPVEAAAASGILKSSLFSRFASAVQRAILNRGDVWSSISPDMVQQLDTVNSRGVPVHLCPNWLTDSLSKQIDRLPSKVNRATNQPPRLLYCGTMGKKQGLREFCESLSQSEHAFEFEIRGEGGEAAAVRQWVQSSGDSRFRCGGLLSQSEFVQAIDDADWFVIPQKPHASSAFFPSKLIPSVSVGTPILAICEQDSPLGNEVTDSGIGLVVPWLDAGQLTWQLSAIAATPQRYQQYQENCRHRAREYSRDTALDKIESLVRQQSQRSRGRAPQFA